MWQNKFVRSKTGEQVSMMKTGLGKILNIEVTAIFLMCLLSNGTSLGTTFAWLCCELGTIVHTTNGCPLVPRKLNV